MDDETRTITIEFSLGADGFAGQARDANGTGVAFAGWLGLIAALDTLVAVDGEQAFAVPLGITALAAEPAGSAVTDDQKGTTP